MTNIELLSITAAIVLARTSEDGNDVRGAVRVASELIQAAEDHLNHVPDLELLGEDVPIVQSRT